MSTKGSRRERELVNMFSDDGFAVMRAPASGGATDRELPDILASNGDLFVAVEAKSRNEGYIYIDGEEVVSLLHFAVHFGALPRIGLRYNRSDWYFVPVSALHRTNGGNYRASEELRDERGTIYDEFITRNG